MTAAAAIVRETAVDVADRLGARNVGHDVVFLPTRRTYDGLGVYSQSLLFAVKVLRAQGVDAAYLDPPETRRFEIKKGAALDAVLTIASNTGSGLLTAGILAGIARALRRQRDDEAPDVPLEVRVVNTSGASSREYTLRGTPDAVLAAIDKLQPDRTFDADTGPGAHYESDEPGEEDTQ
jgi:hypothetical protein